MGRILLTGLFAGGIVLVLVPALAGRSLLGPLRSLSGADCSWISSAGPGRRHGRGGRHKGR
jgi:hypothetical protein